MKKFTSCFKKTGKKDESADYQYALLRQEDERQEEIDRHTARMLEIREQEMREIQERRDRREREREQAQERLKIYQEQLEHLKRKYQ